MHDLDKGITFKLLAEALELRAEESPFPWQLELLNDFLEGRSWDALDLPTGLGKTSVLPIWLIARAFGAPLPRRIVYIVDRRAVVDQATSVALSLRDFVERTPEIAQRLGLSDRQLPISTLRGQYVDNRKWLNDPASPAIIVGTVDMIGSRLLFQGYGVSRKMRPYHAGLLGCDTLAVLDEAHLVPPFEQMLRDISNGQEFRPRDDDRQKLIPRFHLLSLSATGRSGPKDKLFRLTPEDLDHLEIDKRLSAEKRIAMRPLAAEENLVDALAKAAWELTDHGKQPRRCLIFCNRREDAVKTRDEITKLAKGNKKTGIHPVSIETELFVGGRRVRERQDAATRLEALGLIAAKGARLGKAVFLFATSAAEVGVDLDADCLVCDLVPWERMVQRLGRVNRRGNASGGADVVVLVPKEPNKKTKDALEKSPEKRSQQDAKLIAEHDRLSTTQRVIELLPGGEGFRDGSTGAFRILNERAEKEPETKALLRCASTPEPLRPALTAAVVGSWSMTSLEFHPGRPDIEPWLRGWIEDDPPQTRLLWRTHLPVREGGEYIEAGSKKEVEAFFEAAPPHVSEILETETFRVLDWLAARGQELFTAGAQERENEPCKDLGGESIAAIVISSSGKLRKVLSGNDLNDDKGGKKKLAAILAGATIVVDSRIAGLDDGGLLDPKQTSPPRTSDDGKPWMRDTTPGADQPAPVIRFRVRSATASECSSQEKSWRERFRFVATMSEEGEPRQWLIVEKWRADAENEEDRSTSVPQLLDDHRKWAEDRARALAVAFDLPEPYGEMLRASAFLHDEGKRSQIWQQAFNAPQGDQVWAKTEGPINFALLNSYRHEFGSLTAVEGHERIQSLPEDLRDLALHLIAAHHGFGRPVIASTGCGFAPPSALEPFVRAVALRFERMHLKWGPWGLAWWESLVRAADQQASRDNDARLDDETITAAERAKHD